MHIRCSKRNHPRYHQYGGAGIAVCDKWKTFQGFLDDMGERPEGTSLDRIDNEKGYSKENCRWADSKQQQRNRKNNRLFTHNGITMCLSEWVEKLGLRYATVSSRLHRGLTLEESLFYTPRHCGRHSPSLITINGESKTVREWSELHGISRHVIYYRIRNNWANDNLLDPVSKPKIN